MQSKVPKVFNPVYDDSVEKEWTKDKIDDGINHLNGVKPRLEELRKIASGKEKNKKNPQWKKKAKKQHYILHKSYKKERLDLSEGVSCRKERGAFSWCPIPLFEHIER